MEKIDRSLRRGVMARGNIHQLRPAQSATEKTPARAFQGGLEVVAPEEAASRFVSENAREQMSEPPGGVDGQSWIVDCANQEPRTRN